MKIQLLLTIMLITGNCVWAKPMGPSTSGGGLSVVCRDSQGAIKSAELLDLYEARKSHGLHLVSSTGEVKNDYFEAVKRTYILQEAWKNNPTDSQIEMHYKSFLNSVRWTAQGQSLPFLGDQGKTAAIPAGCRLEQIAIFHDDSGEHEVIDVDKEIWNALPPLHQAALVMHEVVYKLNRLLSDSTSESTRAEVGYRFAVNSVPVTHGLPKEKMICSAISEHGENTSVFYIYRQAHSTILQFTQLMGRPLINKTVTSTEGIPFAMSWKKPYFSPDRKNIFPTVEHQRAPLYKRVALLGLYGQNAEIAITYESLSPIKIDLFINGSLKASNLIKKCSWVQ